MLNDNLLPEFVLNSSTLIRSDFNQTYAAGEAHGKPSVPYGGLFYVVDTTGKLSMDSGTLIIASAAIASGNPLLTYNNNLIRKAGRAAKTSVLPNAGAAPLRF